jgi:hypothetical protein
MRFHFPDWKWACIGASCLFGVAAFIVFVIRPGGFEGQAVWFFLLFPGTVAPALLSDLIHKFAPILELAVYWVLWSLFNFGWYWGISYAIIRIFHASGWKVGSPEF